MINILNVSYPDLNAWVGMTSYTPEVVLSQAISHLAHRILNNSRFYNGSVVVAAGGSIALPYAAYKTYKSWQRQTLQKKLDEWIRDPQAQGNKQEAARRIFSAWQHHPTSLDLSQLGLTYLPPSLLATFPRLQKLNLSHNALKALRDLHKHPKLKELYLSDNQLTTPPDLHDLSDLEVLSLSRNQLQNPPDLHKHPKLQILALSDNQLKDSPDLKQCPLLETLDISNNQLTTSPDLGNSSKLGRLTLAHNQLTTPPDLQGTPNLSKLNLSHNQLTTSPTLPPNSKICILKLSHNQLTSLDPSTDTLSRLQALECRNNPHLNTLPLTLGNIPTLTHLTTAHTQIPPEQKETILAACRASRTALANQALSAALTKWNRGAQYNTSQWMNDFPFLTEEKEQIRLWLDRLAVTPEFTSNQDSLDRMTCQILAGAVVNSQFRELFVTQIGVNNTACEDRSAMAFNELYVAWRLMCPSHTLSPQECVELLQGAGRTLAFHAALTQQISEHRKNHLDPVKESVEVFLYYELQLGQKLGLLTAIQSMIHSDIGKRDWIDRARLEKAVKDTYRDEMLRLPVFEWLLKQDADAHAEWNEIETSYQDRLNAAMQNTTDAAVVARCAQIQTERDNALTQLKEKWFDRQLSLARSPAPLNERGSPAV